MGASVPDLHGAPRVAAWLAWTETTVLALAVPAAALLFRPDDPFFLEAPFCWPLLGPLVAGLRYGFLHGVACALLLLAATAVDGSFEVPGELALGLLVSGALAGEFQDLWRRRIERLLRTARHEVSRSAEFVRSYHLLRASHDRLEQRLRSGRSLRAAVTELQLRLAHVAGSADLERSGAAILQLFAEHASVQAATLHPVEEGRLGPVAARLGEVPASSADDPLVEAALASAELVLPSEPELDPTRLCAALPLADVDGQIHGMLCVQSLPLGALEGENAEMLAVLGARVGDSLSRFGRSAPEQELNAFAGELRRALWERRTMGLPATLVRLRLDGVPPALYALLLSCRRSLDRSLLVETDGAPALLALLPLTDEPGARGYAARLRDELRERSGSQAELAPECLELTGNETAESLGLPCERESHAVDRVGRVGL